MRTALRLARLGACLASGLAIAVVAFPHAPPARRAEWMRRWSRDALAALGVEVHVAHAPRDGGLLVANHVSWLDVLAICATAPAAFVAKSELRGWPLLGRLATAAGTIYIERASRRDVVRVNELIRARLREGWTVVVFPEGTTTDGVSVAGFRSALLAPALAAGLPVQPVALRYRAADGGPGTHAAYCGDTSFWQSLRRIAAAPRTVAHVAFLGAIGTGDGGTKRRAVADAARERILAELRG